MDLLERDVLVEDNMAPARCSVYDSFIEKKLDDFSLVQIVTEQTRHYNVLDIILTSNPKLVLTVDCIPDLSDLDIVSAEVSIKPTQAQQRRRKNHLYTTADWNTFRLPEKVSS